MKAYVLIKIHAGEVNEVVKSLRRIEGVVEAHMTFLPVRCGGGSRDEGCDRVGSDHGFDDPAHLRRGTDADLSGC